MIINPNRDLISLLFNLEGSIVPAIAPKIIAAAVLGLSACFLRKYRDHVEYDFTSFTVFGVALSLFLGFRNNACYARWWEARNQWGKQVIAVRNFARAVYSCVPERTHAERIVKYASAHSHAMRHQLREDETAVSDRNKFLSKYEIEICEQSPNAADQILTFASKALSEFVTTQYAATNVDVPNKSATVRGIDSVMFFGIHNHLSEMGAVQGACERLKSTPVPFAYSLLVYRTACLYILLVPFAMVDTAGWFTPLIMAIIAYVFFGLDELALQLERPFSTSVQAIPLTALCRTIDVSVATAIGESPPQPVSPTRTVLL